MDISNFAFPVLPKDSIVSSDTFVQCVNTPGQPRQFGSPLDEPDAVVEMLEYQAKATLQVLAMYIKLSSVPAPEGEPWPSPDMLESTRVVEKLVHQFFDPENAKKDAMWYQRSMKTLYKYNTAVLHKFSALVKDMTMEQFLNWMTHLVYIDGKIYQSPRSFTFWDLTGSPAEWVEGLGAAIKTALEEALADLVGPTPDATDQEILQEVKDSLGLVDSPGTTVKSQMNLAMAEVTVLASTGTGHMVPKQMVLVVVPDELILTTAASLDEAMNKVTAMRIAQVAVVKGMKAYHEYLENYQKR